MTKQQRIKSVAIAKDVLKQLKYIQPAHLYIDIDEDGQNILQKRIGEQLQTALPKVRKHCSVCMLGACFLSHVGLYNKFKINDMLAHSLIDSEGDIKPLLRKSMGSENVILLESAYEMITDWGESDETPYFASLRLSAAKFGQKYYDDGERMKAIMKNVIENNGEFIPPPIDE